MRPSLQYTVNLVDGIKTALEQKDPEQLLRLFESSNDSIVQQIKSRANEAIAINLNCNLITDVESAKATIQAFAKHDDKEHLFWIISAETDIK